MARSANTNPSDLLVTSEGVLKKGWSLESNPLIPQGQWLRSSNGREFGSGEITVSYILGLTFKEHMYFGSQAFLEVQ